MIETHPLWNKLIKPIRDQSIHDTIKSFSVEILVPFDKNFTFSERLLPINILHKNFNKWISKNITGLENLENRYVTNGNTNFIDQVLLDTKPNRIVTLKNDYSYYTHISKALKIEKLEIDLDQLTDLKSTDLFFISVPFSWDGNNLYGQRVIDYCCQNKIQLAIDVAYAGTTSDFKINIPNNENVFLGFTFSKTFGIPYNRIGVCYSSNKIAGLETMNSIGYVNLSGVNIVNRLLKIYPINYLYNKYYVTYLEVCKEFNLTPSECILFAYDKNNQRICTTEHIFNFQNQSQDNVLS